MKTTPWNSNKRQKDGHFSKSEEYPSRRDGRKAKSTKSNVDHLMIVDSMGRYLEADRLYKSKRTIIRRLHGKDNITAAVECAKETNELNPTAVTLIVGTNDLWRKPAEDTFIEMKNMATTMAGLFTKSTILMSEIMPRPYPRSFNNKAADVNRELHSFQQNHTRVKIIQHHSMWEDMSLFEQDNLHLSEVDGTAALVSNLKHTLNPVLGLPQYSRKGQKHSETRKSSSRSSYYQGNQTHKESKPRHNTPNSWRDNKKTKRRTWHSRDMRNNGSRHHTRGAPWGPRRNSQEYDRAHYTHDPKPWDARPKYDYYKDDQHIREQRWHPRSPSPYRECHDYAYREHAYSEDKPKTYKDDQHIREQRRQPRSPSPYRECYDYTHRDHPYREDKPYYQSRHRY